MASRIFIVVLTALLFGACAENSTPQPQDMPDLGPDIGPNQPEESGPSIPIPTYGGTPSWEPLDGAPIKVLQLLRVQMERTFVLNVAHTGVVQVVDLTNPTNPTLVTTLPFQGNPTAIFESGEWVLLVVNRWENQTSSTDVLVIDGSDLSAPTIAGTLNLDDYAIDSALLGERLLLTLSGNQGADVVGVTWSTTGQPVADARINIGPLAGVHALNDKHMVLVGRDTSPSPTTAENNATPAEAAEIHVFDANYNHGSVVVPGPVYTLDTTADVLRVGFQTSQTGSFTIEQVLRTFDISDLSAISRIDSEKIVAESPLIFVPAGAVYGTTSVPIAANGQIGTPSGTGLRWWQDNWRVLNSGQILVVEAENSPNQATEMKVRLMDVATDTAQITELAAAQLNTLGEQLQIGAYQVIEDVVSVLAEDGLTEETGLILVPYSVNAGWNQSHGALQIFTFSETTVSARGAIGAYARVPLEGIFLGNKLTLMNGAEISTHDVSDLDSPLPLSRLELTPTITHVLSFGDYVLRRHADFNYNTGTLALDRLNDQLEVVLAQNLHGEALSTFEVPVASRLDQVGTTLVATSYERGATSEDYIVHIEVWDLSNPLMPTKAPRLTVQNFPPHLSDLEAGVDNYRTGPRFAVFPIENGLIYVERNVKQIAKTQDVPFQSWASVKLHLLDLRDPAQPVLGPVVEPGANTRVVDIVGSENSLHLTTWEHITVEGDAYTFVRHQLQTVDYSNLNAPTLSPPIDVAGRVLRVDGDVFITFDGVQSDDRGVHARITRQRLDAAGATTEATHILVDRDAHDVRVVGSSVLIANSARYGESLSLEIITTPELEVIRTMELGVSWVSGSTDRHLAFDGLSSLIVDVEDPLNPDFFNVSVSARGRQMLRLGDALLIAAGRKGLLVEP